MMTTVMSKMVFQSKLPKTNSYPPRMNSEVTEQRIFLIEHGVHFVSEDEVETDNISEWTIAPMNNMMTFHACRLTIRTSSFTKMRK